MNLDRPVPLNAAHQLDEFSLGVYTLDQWLKRRALKNQVSGASKNFVVCELNKVRVFCSLAYGAVTADGVSGRFRRNMPDPIPVVILGRLAIDHSLQGKGLGRILIRDAGMRILQASQTLGIRGMMVHALTEGARNFYLRFGFEVSHIDPMMLLITLHDLENCFEWASLRINLIYGDLPRHAFNLLPGGDVRSFNLLAASN